MELAPASLVEGAKCSEVSVEDAMEILEKTVPEMIELLKAQQGKGLAAPQVGIMKKFFVMLTGDNEYKVFFNTKYYGKASRTQTQEACLTYGKDVYVKCKRFKAIQAHYDDVIEGQFRHEKVNVKGFDAFAFQHETDHLSGITIFM